MKLRPFVSGDAAAWDALVDAASNGTFLHARRFLAYHGARFMDASLVIEHDNGALAAVFPAARDPADAAHVISHPGATYGGLVAPDFSSADILAALEDIASHYAAAGYTRLTYKSVPHHLTAAPSEGDVHALWRLGAVLARRDLWGVVRTDHEDMAGVGRAARARTRRKRQVRAAEGHDLEVFDDSSDAAYRHCHQLLADNLRERHGVAPVHSVAELLDLRDRLGADVQLLLAARKGRRDAPLAAIWLFRYGDLAWHTQYIAASDEGRECRATHLLFQHLLDGARAAGISALSYGAVTEQGGRLVNDGLERFKADFGAGLVVHDFYTLALGPR